MGTRITHIGEICAGRHGWRGPGPCAAHAGRAEGRGTCKEDQPGHGRSLTKTVDLLILGGDALATATARDAAGRGLAVTLCHEGDLGEGAHSSLGALLNTGKSGFSAEEAVLCAMAPHLVRRLPLVALSLKQGHAHWLGRLRRFLTPVSSAHHDETAPGAGIRADVRNDGERTGCFADTARFAALNAADAKARGADIRTRTSCSFVQLHSGLWQVEATHAPSGAKTVFEARAIVSAGRPPASGDGESGRETAPDPVPAKSAYFVLKKFWTGGHAFLLSGGPGGDILLRPLTGELAIASQSLSTDIIHGAAADPGDQLSAAVNRFFQQPLSPADILRSGVADGRLTYDLPANDIFAGLPPFGTAFVILPPLGPGEARRMAEKTLDRLKPIYSGLADAWTEKSFLPGGDLAEGGLDRHAAHLADTYPWLPGPLARHFAERYGARAGLILGGAGQAGELGTRFGPLLFEAEACYLLRGEWAHRPADLLDRRTNHGLLMNAAARKVFSDWFAGLAKILAG